MNHFIFCFVSFLLFFNKIDYKEMFSPVELLSFPFIQFCDNVSEGAINPGNNDCKSEISFFLN